MKILCLTKYSRLGASSRLRTIQYLSHFETFGDVHLCCLFDDDYLIDVYGGGRRSPWVVVALYLKRLAALKYIFSSDLIWIEKEVFPYVPACFEYFFKVIGKKYVVDYDDAIFHNYDLSANPIVRKFLGGKIDSVMRNAACVIAGNSYLAARATAAGAEKVVIVPTVVDQTRYISRHGSNSGDLIIGWIGSPSTQKYLINIRDALVIACQRYGARLMLIGAGEGITFEFPGVSVEVVSWSEETEANLIRKMDIGIMPLSDGPWEKGKCGYKLIQYMACSIPVIASPVGVNVDIVRDSKAGLLADSLDEWMDALTHLLSSDAQRIAMGNAGRAAVVEKYSLQVQAPILVGVLKSLVPN